MCVCVSLRVAAGSIVDHMCAGQDMLNPLPVAGEQGHGEGRASGCRAGDGWANEEREGERERAVKRGHHVEGCAGVEVYWRTGKGETQRVKAKEMHAGRLAGRSGGVARLAQILAQIFPPNLAARVARLGGKSGPIWQHCDLIGVFPRGVWQWG